ncbi:ABC transporter permease [Terrarubrum flagellatum]|uniref:ABC transporter permease n=1 Tax=Terrirubrum flagellatum TaxID=2895980 RepID=UPI0031452693
MSASASYAMPASAPRALLLHRFLRQRSAIIGGAIVLVVVLVAILAPWIAPHPYDATDLVNVWAPPDAINWLGTDKLGRDIASRLIIGARTSLIVALSVVVITLFVGVTLGMIAGYFGGWTEAIIMRVVDIVLAFPEVVFAILVAAVIGPGVATVIVALSLVWWPGIARLARSLVLVQKQELYVDAAVVSATPPFEILRRHLLPNIVAPLLVRASVGVGFIIMAEATLSFLGLGVQEPTPSWGGMIRDGLPALRSDPYLAVSGSIVLGLTIIGFNLLGDGLRDTLDPRLHGR